MYYEVQICPLDILSNVKMMTGTFCYLTGLAARLRMGSPMGRLAGTQAVFLVAAHR